MKKAVAIRQFCSLMGRAANTYSSKSAVGPTELFKTCTISTGQRVHSRPRMSQVYMFTAYQSKFPLTSNGAETCSINVCKANSLKRIPMHTNNQDSIWQETLIRQFSYLITRTFQSSKNRQWTLLPFSHVHLHSFKTMYFLGLFARAPNLSIGSAIIRK